MSVDAGHTARFRVTTAAGSLALAQAATATLTGLILLPLALGGGTATLTSGRPENWIWLIVAIALVVWVLFQTPAVVAWLELGLRRLPETPISGGGTARKPPIAELVVAVAALVLIQAILRKPLVLVLGGLRDPSSLEAGYAAVGLAALLILLQLLFRAARETMQAQARRALDVVVPTTRSEIAVAVASATTAPPRTVIRNRRSAPPAEATVASFAPDPTVASTAGDSTIASSEPLPTMPAERTLPSLSRDTLKEG
jgi:hypothetical protein